MRVVLADTQIALWMMLDSEELPEHYRALAARNDIAWIFHQASLWEVQIKYDLGKLKLPKPPDLLLPEIVTKTGFQKAGIEDAGIFMLSRLPPIHRDPFDRLLVAHAILHAWEIATTDQTIPRYPVRTI